MTKRPQVSVILPVYNVELYLIECLDSVLNQSFNDYELIAVNDGSTDSSLQILQEYQAKFLDKLVIVDQPNKGLSGARNTGLDNARGELIYFLDSDDWILPNTLEVCVEAFTSNACDLVIFNGKAFCDDMPEDMVSNYNYNRNLPHNSYNNGHTLFLDSRTKGSYVVQSCCYMYRLSSQPNLRFIEGIIHEDNYFSTLLFMRASKIKVLENPFFQRRIRSESITTSSVSFKNAHGLYETISRLSNEMPKSPISDVEATNYLNFMFREAYTIELEINGGSLSFKRRYELLRKYKNVLTTTVKFQVLAPSLYKALKNFKP